MHAWYTCIRSSLMQASPGHMLLIAYMFTAIISCDPVGQGRATPPDQARRRSWCCTKGAPVLDHSGPRHVRAKSRPLLMSTQRSSPSHWALHVLFSCRWIHLVPEEEQSTLQATDWSPHFRLLFIHNTVYGFSFAAKKSGLGKKGHKNFSSASQFE